MSSKTAPRQSPFDYELFTAALFCVLGLVGLWLVNTPWFWRQFTLDQGGTPMGEVVQRKGQVRYRPQGVPLWVDVLEGEKPMAYAGGAIYAGPSSTAALDLLDGPMIEIEENSLVQLEADKDGSSQVVLGNAQVKLTFRRKGDAVVLLAGGERIRLMSKKAGLTVRATLKGGSLSAVGLDADGFQVVREPAAPQTALSMDTEAASVVVAQVEDLPSLAFSTAWWDVAGQRDALRVQVPVSANADGGWPEVSLFGARGKLASEQANNGKAVFVLEEKDALGLTAYAVAGREGQGSITVKKAAPRITQVLQQAEGVMVVWAKTLFTQEYELELSSSRDFSAAHATHRVESNFIAFKEHGPQGQWTRVRSHYRDGPGPWSEPVHVPFKPQQ